MVAVKIANNTDSEYFVNKDFSLYCGNNRLVLLSPEEIRNTIKQSWPAYAFYYIGCLPFNPIDVLVFGAIGAANMAVAGTSNKKLLEELQTFDIRSKNIKKGETMIGIVGFRSMHSDPITIRVD